MTGFKQRMKQPSKPCADSLNYQQNSSSELFVVHLYVDRDLGIVITTTTRYGIVPPLTWRISMLLESLKFHYKADVETNAG